MKGAARERVELALQMADETDGRMYDAELLRIRAHTTNDQDAQHTGLRAAIELAQTQGAPIFELRAAADDFEQYRNRDVQGRGADAQGDSADYGRRAKLA